MRGGDRSAGLKRLLPQRIQVLLLPALLERVADDSDNSSDHSNHDECDDDSSLSAR